MNRMTETETDTPPLRYSLAELKQVHCLPKRIPVRCAIREGSIIKWILFRGQTTPESHNERRIDEVTASRTVYRVSNEDEISDTVSVQTKSLSIAIYLEFMKSEANVGKIWCKSLTKISEKLCEGQEHVRRSISSRLSPAKFNTAMSFISFTLHISDGQYWKNAYCMIDNQNCISV